MNKTWPIDRSRSFDSVVLSIWGEKEVKMIMNEPFVDYLKNSVSNEKELEELLQSIASQQSEKRDMQTNKNNPLYGDEVAFEHYCRVKYKKVYDHINRMIDLIEGQR